LLSWMMWWNSRLENLFSSLRTSRQYACMFSLLRSQDHLVVVVDHELFDVERDCQTEHVQWSLYSALLLDTFQKIYRTYLSCSPLGILVVLLRWCLRA
jgi:hypothetical protein